MNPPDADRRWLLGAALLLLVVYFALLGERSLWVPDEGRYAEISREMTATGDWVAPRFLGLRYFEKPVLGYWMNAAAQLAFGHNNFAVRFASTLSIVLSALLLGMLATRLTGRARTGVAAATVYLTIGLVSFVGTYAALDSMLALWMTAAMVAFHAVLGARTSGERVRRYAVFGACCGLGFLTKGFVALAVPVIAVVPFMVWHGRFREIAVWGWLAVVAAALVALPWAAAVHVAEPDYWRYFFWEEHIRRFASARAQHRRPWWYFLPVFALTAMPWTPLLPAVMADAWRRRAQEAGALLYLLAWLLLPFVFFSIAKGKVETYILPCMAPFAILVAMTLDGDDGFAGRRWTIAAWCNVAFGLLACGVAAAGLAFSPWSALLAENGGVAKAGALFAALALWSVCAWAARRAVGAVRVALLALAPVALMLASRWVEPPNAASSLAPQRFVDAQAPGLAPDALIVTNNVGVAGLLAWSFSRSDIYLLERSGEVRYGLGYPDGEGRLLQLGGFARWLDAARAEYQVGVFLRAHGKGEFLPVPAGDRQAISGRFRLIVYERLASDE